MDQRSKVQLMMQHTVEGLSVAAISYYTIGLIKYLLDAAYNSGIDLEQRSHPWGSLYLLLLVR